MLVLIGVSPAAKGKLIAAAAALLGDPSEVFDGHVRLLD